MARALLTDRQKNVAELKAAGLTRREIAERLTESEGQLVTADAVKQRLNRARKRTAARFAELVARKPVAAAA